MQTRIIDGSSYGEVGKRGIVAVTGPDRPTTEEKIECVETVTKLGDDGWAIAADLTTPIGKLTRRAADAINAPFIDVRQAFTSTRPT
ncbi:hypothetical protein [Diaminobutyricibacter sp. McL0608]|uniref:hypothetical protein n=1 Tax=Leifsonia sp. McL0608 TaxID=3143537 RepID=UPI0031F2FB84